MGARRRDLVVSTAGRLRSRPRLRSLARGVEVRRAGLPLLPARRGSRARCGTLRGGGAGLVRPPSRRARRRRRVGAPRPRSGSRLRRTGARGPRAPGRPPGRGPEGRGRHGGREDRDQAERAARGVSRRDVVRDAEPSQPGARGVAGDRRGGGGNREAPDASAPGPSPCRPDGRRPRGSRGIRRPVGRCASRRQAHPPATQRGVDGRNDRTPVTGLPGDARPARSATGHSTVGRAALGGEGAPRLPRSPRAGPRARPVPPRAFAGRARRPARGPPADVRLGTAGRLPRGRAPVPARRGRRPLVRPVRELPAGDRGRLGLRGGHARRSRAGARRRPLVVSAAALGGRPPRAGAVPGSRGPGPAGHGHRLLLRRRRPRRARPRGRPLPRPLPLHGRRRGRGPPAHHATRLWRRRRPGVREGGAIVGLEPTRSRALRPGETTT